LVYRPRDRDDRISRSCRRDAGLFRRHVALERLGPYQALFRRYGLQGCHAESRERRGKPQQTAGLPRAVLSALTANEFELLGAPLIGNESQFFAADLAYESHFATGEGLRPHLRVEMSFHAPALKPINRPLQSLIAQAQKQPPEVSGFPCIDPIETAADKLSTLAWRVCARKRGGADDDPTIIRHLHDLAALEGTVAGASGFAALAQKTAEDDTGRGGQGVPSNPKERFAAMLEFLHNDELWASEYETFVLQVSFAGPGETISFAEAFAATRRLVATVYTGNTG